MTNIVVELDSTAALFSNPESDEAKLQNLLLNMIGGLEYKDLSMDEKELLKRNGCVPDQSEKKEKEMIDVSILLIVKWPININTQTDALDWVLNILKLGTTENNDTDLDINANYESGIIEISTK